jgi:hypothetical protein
MPLDFPISPTDGQTYNGYVYSTSVGAWQAKPSAQSPFYTRDTPPSNPVTGDSWFNTNDGTMYIYTYDGNSYQWVEHRSQIAKSQVGLVPIVPASVAVGSGTGSVDVAGMVTFAGTNTVSLNGVFSSTYKYYRIEINITAATGYSGHTMGYRYRTATDDSTSIYYFGAQYVFANGTVGTLNSSDAGASFGKLFWMNAGMTYGGAAFDLHNPGISNIKNIFFNGAGSHPSGSIYNYGSGIAYSTTAYTGITFLSDGTGTFTGSVKVYGYN